MTSICSVFSLIIDGLFLQRYGPYLLLLPVEKIAVIALDTTISSILRSGNAGVPTTTLTAEIGGLIETEVNLRKLKNSKDASSNWAKRLLKDKPRESIQLYKKIKKITKEIEAWSWDIKVKIGAALVKILLNSVKSDKGENVFTFSSTFNVNTQKRQGLVKISPESFAELDNNRMGVILPRFLPMLVPPQPWNNKEYFGAYLRLKAPILKHTSRLQLEATKKAEMKSVLEGLDYLGKTTWRINKAVYDVVFQARERDMVIGELPNPKDIEIISREDFIEKYLKANEDPNADPEVLKKERNKAYEQWRTRVEKKNAELHSLRCDIQIKLSIADQFVNERMFFPHNLDFRGRAYPIPPNLSHLGSDLCRGILMFDDAKTLGPQGLRWLKIHLANLWGYNKVPFDERIAWVDRNMEKIIDSAKNPLEGEMWWAQAESPYQALATCMELHQAYQLEDPTQYQCRLPVHQDGSCNGLQHYAGLGRDLMGGKAVNLTPSNSPQDVYSKVLEIVLKRIDEDSCIAEDVEDPKLLERRKWALIVKNVVNRKVIKQTVMTSVYGVTKIGARAQVQARLMELFTSNSSVMSAERERELYWAANYVAGLTLVSLHEIFDNAKKIMDWLALVSLMVASEGQTMSWITPLGLPVTQPYRREAHYAVKTVLQNVILTLNSDLLPVSSKKQKTAFPPNFVHSLDATHMLMTCLKMKEQKLTFAAVHDSYWTHAADVSTMNEVSQFYFPFRFTKPTSNFINVFM